MINICFCALISVLCAAGIYFILKETAGHILRPRVPSYIVLHVTDKNKDIEYTIRSFMRSNPESEIILIDKCNDSNIKAIMQSMSKDNKCIHIR